MKYAMTKLLSALLISASLVHGEIQTWTDAAGVSIEAEYAGRNGDVIKLRDANGREASFKLTALSPESQAQIPAETGKPKDPAPAVATKPRPVGAIDLPSEEDIAAFKTDYTNDDGSMLRFHANIGPKRLTNEEKEESYKSGKILYRITCNFTRISKSGSKMTERDVGGSVNIVVLDPFGDMIFSKKASLSGLSSKGGGKSGLFGEVKKSGQYTAYIWMEYQGQLFGTVDTTNLKKTAKPIWMK